MAIRTGDHVAYRSRSGELLTGVVTRKTGQGMVDIRLDGSGRVVRQEGRSLSRMRTNGRARRNIGAAKSSRREGEDRWALVLATLGSMGRLPKTADAPSLAPLVHKLAGVYAKEQKSLGAEEARRALIDVAAQCREGLVAALTADGLAAPDVSDAELYTLLRSMLPAQGGKTYEIYKSAFEGTKEKVFISAGTGGGGTDYAKKKVRSERRRERRYVAAAATKALRTEVAGKDISQYIQERKAAVRILPDPVRTNRAETFICGNVLDGNAYTLNTTAQPRYASHWLTYGDLGLEYRNGRLAFDPKKATYVVQMDKAGRYQPRAKAVPLTLKNFPLIQNFNDLVRKGGLKERRLDLGPEEVKAKFAPGKTEVTAIGGRDRIRPFETIPLATSGELAPVLANAVVPGGVYSQGQTRGTEDPAGPQNVEALQAFFAALSKSKVFSSASTGLRSGYDSQALVPVGITNVGAAWVKSRGSKSGIFDPKSGTFRSTKIQGGRGAGLYPNTALPPQIPAVRLDVDGSTLRVPDNRITPATPVLFSFPKRGSAVPSSNDYEYALDMDAPNAFRESEIVGIRTNKTKDVTAKIVRDYFQVYAPNSPKDRNPYFSWVRERPGQFPDLSREQKGRKPVFDRPCPEPKELEYLEAIRQAGGALSGVISKGFSIKGSFAKQANIGTPEVPQVVQASTIYLHNRNPQNEARARKAEEYLQRDLRGLRYGLGGLSVQFDRIVEGQAIRPYRGRPAADYAIFKDPTLLDHLIPEAERPYVHTAIKRIAYETEKLVETAVKQSVLVAEKKTARRRRGQKRADVKSYVVRASVRDSYVPYPEGTILHFVQDFGAGAGWSKDAVERVSTIFSVSGLTHWPTYAAPKNRNKRVELSKHLSAFKLNRMKDFLGFLQRFALEEGKVPFSKILETAILARTRMDGGLGHLVLTAQGNLLARNYSELFVALVGLSSYRPNDLSGLNLPITRDLQQRFDHSYQLSFAQIAIALVRAVGGPESAQLVSEFTSGLGAAGRKATRGSAIANDLLRKRMLEAAVNAVVQLLPGDKYDNCVALLNYLFWRASTNREMHGWGGGSNFTFAEASVLYLALGLESPRRVGPLSEETVYGAETTDLATLLTNEATELGWSEDIRQIVAAHLEKINEAHFRAQGGRKGSIATYTEQELESVITLLQRLSLGRRQFVDRLRGLHERLSEGEVEETDAAKQRLTVMTRNLREALKIAVAGGHGIEDAARMTRGARGRPARINGFYTYNPVLFEITRSQYFNVTGANEGGKIPFGGFYRYDARKDLAVWRHQDLADSIDQLGFYAQMLYWARMAALQADTPVRTEEDLQAAWNAYWARIIEAAGPDGGKEEVRWGKRTTFVPHAYSQFVPRTFFVTQTSNGVPYTAVGYTFAQSMENLVGLMQALKTKMYVPAMDVAAGFAAEGFHPPRSVGGVGGREEQQLRAREKVRKQPWLAKLGTVLFQLHGPLVHKARGNASASARKAAVALASRRKNATIGDSTKDPAWVAFNAAQAATILGVAGVKDDPAWLQSEDSREPVGNLVHALYRLRSTASTAPERKIQPFHATATDASYLDQTHLNVAHLRRDFKRKLLTLIDEKLNQLEPASA